MKVRTGFVSNSSSSSFIVGVARIKDEKLFNEWVKKEKVSVVNGFDYESDCGHIVSLVDILSGEVNSYQIKVEGKWVIVESFQSSASLDTEGLGVNTKLFIINISNDEGDESFWNESSGECDYDVDIDDFCDKQRTLFEGVCEKNGFDMIDCTYGAGRNG